MPPRPPSDFWDLIQRVHVGLHTHGSPQDRVGRSGVCHIVQLCPGLEEVALPVLDQRQGPKPQALEHLAARGHTSFREVGELLPDRRLIRHAEADAQLLVRELGHYSATLVRLTAPVKVRSALKVSKLSGEPETS